MPPYRCLYHVQGSIFPRAEGQLPREIHGFQHQDYAKVGDESRHLYEKPQVPAMAFGDREAFAVASSWLPTGPESPAPPSPIIPPARFSRAASIQPHRRLEEAIEAVHEPRQGSAHWSQQAQLMLAIKERVRDARGQPFKMSTPEGNAPERTPTVVICERNDHPPLAEPKRRRLAPVPPRPEMSGEML